MDDDMIDRLMQHGIDYDTGLDRFAGNAALLQKLMVRFLDDSHFEMLRASLQVGDVEDAYRSAHSLKGVVGNLSFAAYYEALCPLSEALHAGDLDHAHGLFPAVEAAHMRTVAILLQLR